MDWTIGLSTAGFSKKNIQQHYWSLLLCLVVILLSTTVTAQSKDDSTTNAQKQWYYNILREREIQHAKDSIALELLQAQLQKNHTAAEQKILKRKLDSIQAQDSVSLFMAKDSIDNLRANTNPIPVVFFADTLYNIYAPLGPYSAEKRVADLEKKLKYLYDLPKYVPDSLAIDFHSDISMVRYQGNVIAAVTYIDAIWAGKDLRQMLDDYTRAINHIVVSNRENNTWNKTFARLGMAIIVILLIIFAVYCINRLFMFLVKKLIRSKSKRMANGIKINNYKVFSRAHILSFLIQTFKIVRWILIIVVLYFGFTFILSSFPYTQEWASQITNWIKQPLIKGWLAFVHYLPNLFMIALIIIVYRLINKALFGLARSIELDNLRIKGFYPEWGIVTYKVIRFVLTVLVVVLIFPYLPGAHSDVFKGVSVFIGVLISFGSSSAIANTIAGLVITYMRPFKIGDWIKVGDSVGLVMEKNLLVTRLRTLQNEDITLPNTTILTGKTINYSQSARDPRCKGLVITVAVTIDYEINWRTVTNLLLDAANQTEYILKSPAPFVLHKDFNNYNVGYELNAYIDNPAKMFFIHSDLMHKVMDVFAEAKVEIRSPDYLNFNNVTGAGK